ncbi:class I adenylate-forming enzyme family protein [Phenylobacterium sp.]|jgi:acyl-CoA synthetase (AMP-forming)/AMP-acid ligase II|uniref:class I adenylate-forming enzyme family protein n=1 Tax=Phenylobacterium sp. TaxID=1871053 RepID=UPI002F4287DD
MSIATLLEMAAEAMPDREAVVCGGLRLTYAGLLERSRRAAAQIVAAGAGYAGYLAVNGPAAPVTLFGAALAGVPYSPLNYRLTGEELSALLARIDPALLVCDPAYLKGVQAPAGVTPVDAASFPAPGEGLAEAVESAVAVQLFTSGTTGQPKAALLSHDNLMSYILGTVEFMAAEEDEATLVAAPPYHIAGVAGLLSSIYAGRKMVFLPNFDPKEWIRLTNEERITNAFVVPTMLQRIVEVLDSGAGAGVAPSLRAVAYGGGKAPLSVIERAMALFPGVDFTNAYGLTETSSTICLLGPDDHRAAAVSEQAEVRRRLGSVGRPLPSIELEVRDDHGHPAPPGVPGLIFVRGGQVAGEYREQGDLRDADGWFCTRDHGWLDDEGFLFLEGRADDVIVRGGENISPGEIEDVLLRHPAVRDAAVVGVPDVAWGEAVAAAVVLSAPVTTEELQAWVKASLRSSRAPQVVRVLDSLPYNETGKLLRRVVREILADAG